MRPEILDRVRLLHQAELIATDDLIAQRLARTTKGWSAVWRRGALLEGKQPGPDLARAFVVPSNEGLKVVLHTA